MAPVGRLLHIGKSCRLTGLRAKAVPRYLPRLRETVAAVGTRCSPRRNGCLRPAETTEYGFKHSDYELLEYAIMLDPEFTNVIGLDFHSA